MVHRVVALPFSLIMDVGTRPSEPIQRLPQSPVYVEARSNDFCLPNTKIACTELVISAFTIAPEAMANAGGTAIGLSCNSIAIMPNVYAALIGTFVGCGMVKSSNIIYRTYILSAGCTRPINKDQLHQETSVLQRFNPVTTLCSPAFVALGGLFIPNANIVASSLASLVTCLTITVCFNRQLLIEQRI